MTVRTQKKAEVRKGERGSALVYILIAIALLAALTVSFMEPSSQQTSSQSTFRTITGVKSQIDTIRSAIQECVLRYPNGDINIPNAGGEDEEGARQEYPIRPNSPYYDDTPASNIAATADQLVSNIRCPGDQDGPETKDHAKIFSGKTGKFLPPPPDLFGDWQYYNGPDGVYFWIETDKSDAFLQTALEKLDDTFGECEADVINAGSSNVSMDTEPQTNCPANSSCFRVWVIMDDGSAIHADNASDGCGDAAPTY